MAAPDAQTLPICDVLVFHKAGRVLWRRTREALGLDESHSSRSIFKTLNEAELSESLVYLTCPICEEVLEKDPLFTPCHHTFCGACIRGRLREGEESCAECLAPLKEGDLQPNLMAAKLLSRMRSCCIYKAHGWSLSMSHSSGASLVHSRR